MSQVYREQLASTGLSAANADYVEAFYEDYLNNPDSVPEDWQAYFKSFRGNDPEREVAHGPIKKSMLEHARQKATSVRRGLGPAEEARGKKQKAVLQLINAHRVRGHQAANLNPLGNQSRADLGELDPAYHGLTSGDMQTVFNTGSLFIEDNLPLGDILTVLQTVYLQSVGAEYMHITETQEKRWIQKRLEEPRGLPQRSASQQKQTLELLTAAEGIEKYLHNKYVGQKRFSLEGGESLITALHALIHRSAQHGVNETIIAMAHRGRLNVLVNIMGKSPAELFSEFDGTITPGGVSGSGDVKYHMGFSSDIQVDSDGDGDDDKQMHLVLAFNPSHLEIVNPVAQGSVRARQHRRGDTDKSQVLPILIHGDAAFAGQGVIMEGLQMSQARGFATGGTMHIVVNNQIGFTTSNPLDSRSTLYCTDVGKMVQAPIFHVNADDPDAVQFVTQLAMDYRAEFKKDVIIDLVCYRRHGHNEADEPSATQPMMYQKIKALRTTRQLYADQLVAAGVMDKNEPKALENAYRDGLDEGKNIVDRTIGMVGNAYTVDWSKYTGADWRDPTPTGMGLEQIRTLWSQMEQLPEGFGLHSRVQRIYNDRKKMAAGGAPIDWGFAEITAYAGLLNENYEIRLVGQDSGRGTFFHRHVVFHDQKSGESYVPLRSIAEKQNFTVIDSLLSEEAVLGFEYGYSTTDPNSLVIWEAQFGDFANGAQVVIDQFIASGEAKWGRLCGLTMFLPHGYEGQGPEHSSARLERYLQLCAEHNIQVAVPSTPAQMFHMLRRQMLRNYRRPLIVMTPKSLLRHRLSTSSLEDLTHGQFQPVIDETDTMTQPAERLVVSSGKVYYDLYEKREELAAANVALVRLEQLYPFPHESFHAVLQQHSSVQEVVWCQEEPKNQGAWHQIQHKLREHLVDIPVYYAGRAASASTAAGYHKVHVRQQRQLLVDALIGAPAANPDEGAVRSDVRAQPVTS